MKLSAVVTAILAVNAAGSRTRGAVRTTPARAPATATATGGPLCEHISSSRAKALSTAAAELHSLAEYRKDVNSTLTRLAEDSEQLNGRIQALDRSRAAAVSVRQGESRSFKEHSTETAELVGHLRGAMVSVSGKEKDAHGKGVPLAKKALAAVVGTLEKVHSVQPAQLSLLRSYMAASTSEQAAAVQAVLKDLVHGLQKDLRALEHEETVRAQEFEAFMLQSEPQLMNLRKAKLDSLAQQNETQGNLDRIQKSYEEGEAQLSANTVLFDKLQGQCTAGNAERGIAKPELEPTPKPKTAARVLAPAAQADRAAGEAFHTPSPAELATLMEAMMEERAADASFANASGLGLASQTPQASVYGPYLMESHIDEEITGFSQLCSAPYMGNIYLPIASATSGPPPPGPIITYAHPFSMGAHLIDIRESKRLFRHLVAMGFVVVAHQTGGTFDYCDSSADQLHMITWARTSRFAPRMDFTSVHLLGHSMGGKATLKNAADPQLVQSFNLASATTFMPHCTYGCSVPTIPSLFITGGLDALAPSADTYNVYAAMRVDKVWSYFSTGAHMPNNAAMRTQVLPPLFRFMNCMGMDNVTECTQIFNRYPSCQYGCRHCGCEACDSCVPCWGTNPPAWCAASCSHCSSCTNCQQCSHCTG